MLSLLNSLLDICFLKRGPQHLPYSVVLAVIVSALYMGASFTVDQLTLDSESALTRAAVYTGVSFALVLVILRWRGLKDRLVQTWTAFAGCGIILSIAVTPLAWSLGSAQDQKLNPDPLGTLVFLFLFFWSFVIDAHIFRNALSVSFSVGFLYATLVFAVLSAVRYMLVAPPP